MITPAENLLHMAIRVSSFGNLLAHWTFNDVDIFDSGTMLQNVANPFTFEMLIPGGYTTGEPGVEGQSFLCDGFNAMTMNDDDDDMQTIPFTDVIRFKRDTVSSTEVIFSNNVVTENLGNKAMGASVGLTDTGKIRFRIANRTGSVVGVNIFHLDSAATGFDDDEFHEVKVSYDNTTMRMTIDGGSEETLAISNGLVYSGVSFGFGNVYIGAFGDSTLVNFFSGNVDDIKHHGALI